MEQVACNGSAEQLWTPVYLFTGTNPFQTYNSTHKCLDVPNQRTYQVIMQEWGCFDGTDNVAQMFTFPQ